MRKPSFAQYVLPLYLLVVLLLQIPLQVLSFLAVIVPLALVFSGLSLKNRSLGLLGMIGVILLSLPQLTLSFMDDVWGVFLSVFFVFLPSVLLLGCVLQIENQRLFWFPVEKKRPLLIAGIVLLCIFFVFYLLAFIFEGTFLFSASTTSGQVILLATISIIVCIPLILR